MFSFHQHLVEIIFSLLKKQTKEQENKIIHKM